MSGRSTQFIVFCAFNLGALLLGYIARRRGWLREEKSRSIHFVTVVFVWSVVGLLSLWKLPPQARNLWLLLIEPLLVAVPALGMIPLARRMGADRAQTGVLAIAAGGGNLGFTLGAYLCYTLLAEPTAGMSSAQAADAALAYAIAQVTIMSVCTVLLLYPIAQAFGPTTAQAAPAAPGDSGAPSASAATPRGGPSTPDPRGLMRLMADSLFDLRAAMLYTAVVGAALAYLRVPFPRAVDRLHLLDVLFYLGGFGGYVGIGLRLHVGHATRRLGPHVLLAAVKFLGIPLVTLALLALANLAPAAPPPLAGRVMLIEALMPTAIQTVIIANLFHLDARLASGLWLINTAAFLLAPLPLLLWAWS